MYESSIPDRTYVVGRLFVYHGVNHLREAQSMAPYAESKGVPTPESAVTLSGLPLIFGRSQPFAWRKVGCFGHHTILGGSLARHACLLTQ
jgi:hypothetical protein